MKRVPATLESEEPVKRIRVLQEPKDDLPVAFTPEEICDELVENIGYNYGNFHQRAWFGIFSAREDKFLSQAIYFRACELFVEKCYTKEHFEDCTQEGLMVYKPSMVDDAINLANFVERKGDEDLDHKTKNALIFNFIAIWIKKYSVEVFGCEVKKIVGKSMWAEFCKIMQNNQ